MRTLTEMKDMRWIYGHYVLDITKEKGCQDFTYSAVNQSLANQNAVQSPHLGLREGITSRC